MIKRHIGLYLSVLLVASISPLAARAQTDAPATGFQLSARLAQSSLQELVSSAVGGPEFTLGHRGERVSIGIGIGFSRLNTSDRQDVGTGESESTTSATFFQVGPDVLVRVWESPSRATLGHLALGATIGRLSAKEEDTFPGSPAFESTATGTLYGVRVGLGGEHFLDRNFSIGVEGGFKGQFASGIEEEGSSDRLGIGASGAYAALRLSVVLGS